MSRESMKGDFRKSVDEVESGNTDITGLVGNAFARVPATYPPPKKQLTIRLDEDVLAWLKGQGRGYQTRINAILRAYYDAHQHGKTRRS